MIISGREVRFGHACSTSLRCGHSIQLKGNNFLATPREVGGSAKLAIVVAFKLFFLPFFAFVFSAFSSLLHLWWPCWRTIHWVWLAMPVICISYFVILRPPGNSHPGTGPAHYKYLRPPFNVTLPPNSLLLPLHFMSPASFSLFRCFQILELVIASTELASFQTLYKFTRTFQYVSIAIH